MIKSMQEIRGAELLRFQERYGSTNLGALNGFKAGWDARDKIDNEALKFVVEELKYIAQKYYRKEVTGESAHDIANDALTKIRELMGQK